MRSVRADLVVLDAATGSLFPHARAWSAWTYLVGFRAFVRMMGAHGLTKESSLHDALVHTVHLWGLACNERPQAAVVLMP